MKYEEIEENRELYQERIEWRTEQTGTTMGSALLPAPDTPEDLLDAFHELMTDRGPDGIEYAQEALHTEGADYFIKFFDPESEDFEGSEDYDVFDDFNNYIEESD